MAEMSRDRFQGRTVVVIGAGAAGEVLSNGRAAAILFAREGGNVFAVDRSADALVPTRRAIEDEGGVVETCVADITSPSDITAAFARCMARFGTVDVLHNNVGVAFPGGAAEISGDVWQRSLDINLTGAFLCCKAALPIMEAQGKGAIVNVSSVAAIRVGTIPYIAYSASKAGLTHMSKALALDYARRGIRVNNVLPGAIDAAAARDTWVEFARTFAGGDVDALARKRVENTPMGRLGSPWDVAHAALYLASDDAAFVTGIDLIVDGGLSCR